MKKLLALFIATTMLFTACAPATSVAPEAAAPAVEAPSAETATETAIADAEVAVGGDLKGKLIGVITPNATHGFLAESIQHAEAEVKQQSEKLGFEYKFITANESSEQTNAVDTVLNMKPDCVVLWPITGDELRSSAQLIMDAGVPLIIYDRLIEGFTPTSWVMGDNETIGKESGLYFNEFFKDDLAKGEVSILEFKGDSSTVPMQRSNGFASTRDKNFKIVQEFDTGWQRQTSMEHMENFLNSKSVAEIEAIRAIFTHDDEIVLGVMDAIKNYSGPAKLNIKLISGVGGRKENVELFKNVGIEGCDLMTFTFSPSMVRDAIKVGVEVLEGKEIKESYVLPTRMIDKTNVDEYIASEEYITRYSL